MDSDDEYTLPADTLALVNAFKKEQTQREEEAMQGERMPEEDWQLSQFWYSEDTAMRICAEIDAVYADVGEEGADVAFVSTPTLLPYFKKLPAFRSGRLRARLFEYDTRFALLHPEEFVPFDYRNPLQVPSTLHGRFDMVVADPPFLSEECLVKTAQAVRLVGKGNRGRRRLMMQLQKGDMCVLSETSVSGSDASASSCSSSGEDHEEDANVLFCTGAVMEPLLMRLLKARRVDSFRPTHANNLANDFAAYANYAVKTL